MTYTEQRIAATRKRVQIPAYTDRWMMGDRYGCVMKVTICPMARTRSEVPRERDIQSIPAQRSRRDG